MKIEVPRAVLLRALERTAPADTQNNGSPFSGMVLVTAEPSCLRLTLRDHVYASSTSIACVTKAEGEIALPHRSLYDFVRRMAGDVVTAGVRANVFCARSGRDNVELPCLAEPSYPRYPSLETKGDAVSWSALQYVLSNVSYAMHRDAAHPAFAGVRLRIGATELEARSTDGCRFAVAAAGVTISGASRNWTLGSRLVRKISSLVAVVADAVLISETPNQLFLEWPDLSMSALRVDSSTAHDKLPEPEHVIATCRVRRSELDHAMALIANISPDPAGAPATASLRLMERCLRIVGKDGVQTGVTTTIDAVLEGATTNVTVQADSLRDAVQHVGGETLLLAFDALQNVVVLRAEVAGRRTLAFLPTYNNR